MNKVDWHDCKSYESYVIILTQNKHSNTIFKHIQPPPTLPNWTIFRCGVRQARLQILPPNVCCFVNVSHMEWTICCLTHFIHFYHAYNWLSIWYYLVVIKSLQAVSSTHSFHIHMYVHNLLFPTNETMACYLTHKENIFLSNRFPCTTVWYIRPT